VAGVRASLRHSADPAPGTAKDLLDKVQALIDQDRILADEEEAWKQRLAVIRNIGEQGGNDLARNLARGKLSLENLTGVLDYLSQSHEAGSNILRELGVRRRGLARQIEAARPEADKVQRRTRWR
jgi:hypothetical protein